jgi:4-hydroxybenzoate polyprenyltransferase
MATFPRERTRPPEPALPSETAVPDDRPVAGAPRRGPLRAAVVTMRPQEWIKNLLVFAGLLFSAKFKQEDAVVSATFAFFGFCAIASAGYLVNDLHDAELDRRHPTNRRRPIPAGELGRGTAVLLAGLLALLGIGFGLLAGAGGEVAAIVVAYGIATAAYSYGLKHVVIIDVMTIAGLFILRVVAGAVAVDAHASEWLLLCTGMLALFLGFTKRRQEAMSELHATGNETRPVLEHYSLPFLDQMVAMVTTGTVLTYAIYAVNSPQIGSRMLFTVPPVVYGIFRYLYLIYDREDTRSTAAILTEDAGMIVAALVYIVTAFILLAT